MKKAKMALLIPFIFFGCVSAGKYHDLESKQSSLEDNALKTQQQLASCEAESNNLRKKLGMTANENTHLESSVEEMKKAIEEANARKAATEKTLLEFRDITKKFKSLVDSGKLRIHVQNGRMMLALSTDILFSSASARLSSEGSASIREIASILKTMHKQFQVEGHTDNVPIHTEKFPSNWELASARAISVLNTMLASGVPADHISAASYANFEPIDSNDTKAGRTENRRIDIVIVPDLSGLPGYKELNNLSKLKVES